jgi:hypothetical protein
MIISIPHCGQSLEKEFEYGIHDGFGLLLRVKDFHQFERLVRVDLLLRSFRMYQSKHYKLELEVLWEMCLFHTIRGILFGVL